MQTALSCRKPQTMKHIPSMQQKGLTGAWVWHVGAASLSRTRRGGGCTCTCRSARRSAPAWLASPVRLRTSITAMRCDAFSACRPPKPAGQGTPSSMLLWLGASKATLCLSSTTVQHRTASCPAALAACSTRLQRLGAHARLYGCGLQQRLVPGTKRSRIITCSNANSSFVDDHGRFTW